MEDLRRCGGPGLADGLSQTDDSSRRRLTEVMAALADPAEILLLDEPTFELDEPHAATVRRRLCELAGERLVIVATHNRQDCLAVGGWCALLAGGKVQELAPVAQFFAAPATEAGKRYVLTGACNLSGPARDYAGDSAACIWWTVRGLLGGMARPGMLGALAHQAQELRDAGVRHLVCLEERRPYDIAEFRERDIACHHLPIPDMAPPQFGQAVDLCRRLEPEIRDNRGVVMHCRGGLGRTGTLMACVLVWFGDDSQAAIAKVRAARPMAIQSDAQARFIHDFADRVRGWISPAVTT